MKSMTNSGRLAIWLCALAPLHAFSASLPIKPGLWEEETTVKRGGGEPHTVTIKHCLTEADLSKNRFYQTIDRMKSNKACHLDQFNDTGKSVNASWTCSGTNVDMHGSGELVFDTDTRFHVSTSEHTVAAGRALDTSVLVNARWLSICSAGG